jgi:cytochrome c-type biogenesis protein CcmF
MNYIGENLLYAQIGQFFILLSFFASLLAFWGFYKATMAKDIQEKASWKRFARIAFVTEVASVLGILVTLFFIIFNHRYEYYYAFKHSDNHLQFKYLLSCFWEGQEGSFLLWSFWHCVLGLIIIKKEKEWETAVMTVVSAAQVILAMTLFGIYIIDFKLGSNPFVLTRNELPAPIFQDPNYLVKIGPMANGLNELLQNYWMVIHPPVLFLGFASTIVPFAFALSGLWQKKFDQWVNASLPWILFSAAVLGAGIVMGAMWAYESLSFGGYWAWDPVENASLVPWLTLVAGLHTAMIYKHTGHSLKGTYFFYFISFILIIYSTFLTRTGILGDTSVHAFTGEGSYLYWLLGFFMLIAAIPSFGLLIYHRNAIPTIHVEEESSSREFWMFIGSLILFLSAFVITIMTSLPVFNKIFGTNWALGKDVPFQHNRIQIFVAIIIGVLSGFGLYLKFKKTESPLTAKKLWIPLLLSVIFSALISAFGNINYDKYGIGFLVSIHLAIFASVFAVVANASYIWLGLKGNMKKAGAAIAHLGFGMMLLGILISSSKKAVLSHNTTGMNPFSMGSEENPMENITLIRGVPTDMGRFMVTYLNDTMNYKENKRYFRVKFASKDGKEEYVISPDLIKQKKGNGYIANPDYKNYWNKDLFVYLTYYNPNTGDDTTQFKNASLGIGDTMFYSKGLMILNKVEINPVNDRYQSAPTDTALMADITVIAKDGRMYKARPLLRLKNNQTSIVMDSVMSQSLVLAFSGVDEKKIRLAYKESDAILDFITLKAYEFPYILLLWMGAAIMIIGFMLSIYKRLTKK